MSKAKQIILIIVAITLLYVVLGIFIKFLSDQSISTNQALDAAHNMAQYPGTSDFLLAIPWIMYFVPAVIGIVWVVIVLKKEELLDRIGLS